MNNPDQPSVTLSPRPSSPPLPLLPLRPRLATLRRWAAALALFVAVFVVPYAAALAADEYEPLDEATRQPMDPSPYLLGAYGFIWAAVLIYVVLLARGLGRTRADLEALRRRLDASGR